MMDTYKIGFLRQHITLSFEVGEIVPVATFDAAREWIDSIRHEDGFLYPPEVIQRLDDGTDVPNSRRPAHLHHLPASHSLKCGFATKPDDRHRTDASMLMQLVAYLFETWLQFEDWWFDSRVPIKDHGLCLSKTTAERFLSHSYDRWKQWPVRTQRRFVNILFMFNRAPSYQWDWEHFSAQYMVFDALYRTGRDLKLCDKELPHRDRIIQACSIFGVPWDRNKVQQLVQLRNELLHEVIWDGGQPNSAGSGDAILCQYHLRRLNQRLISAIIGFRNSFVSSNWWTSGAVFFGDP
jgi:hypothetical protein